MRLCLHFWFWYWACASGKYPQCNQTFLWEKWSDIMVQWVFPGVNWSHIREPLSQKWGFYCRKSEVKNNLKLYFFQNNVQRKEIGSWEISRNYYWEILEFRKDWSDPIIQNNWIVNEHAKIKKTLRKPQDMCIFKVQVVLLHCTEKPFLFLQA